MAYADHPCPSFGKGGESGGTFRVEWRTLCVKRRRACVRDCGLLRILLRACQTVVGYVFLAFRHGDFNTPETREIGNGGSFGPSKTPLRGCSFCEMARFGLRNVPFYDAKRAVLQAVFRRKRLFLADFWPIFRQFPLHTSPCNARKCNSSNRLAAAHPFSRYLPLCGRFAAAVLFLGPFFPCILTG